MLGLALTVAADRPTSVEVPPPDLDIPASAIESMVWMYLTLALLAAFVLGLVLAGHVLTATRGQFLPRALSLRWARRVVHREHPQFIRPATPADRDWQPQPSLVAPRRHGARSRHRVAGARQWLDRAADRIGVAAERLGEQARVAERSRSLAESVAGRYRATDESLRERTRLIGRLLALRWARRLAQGELERQQFFVRLESIDLQRLEQQQRAATPAFEQWLAHRR